MVTFGEGERVRAHHKGSYRAGRSGWWHRTPCHQTSYHGSPSRQHSTIENTHAVNIIIGALLGFLSWINAMGVVGWVGGYHTNVSDDCGHCINFGAVSANMTDMSCSGWEPIGQNCDRHQCLHSYCWLRSESSAYCCTSRDWRQVLPCAWSAHQPPGRSCGLCGDEWCSPCKWEWSRYRSISWGHSPSV